LLPSPSWRQHFAGRLFVEFGQEDGRRTAAAAGRVHHDHPAARRPGAGSQADFVASVQSDTIHFDTDRYNVDAQSQAILQSQAQWLARYPNKRVTIEGHCDERGTRDYNLALGERRANAPRTIWSAWVSMPRASTS
jgi:peptidoglycan-associated lipoprotein